MGLKPGWCGVSSLFLVAIQPDLRGRKTGICTRVLPLPTPAISASPAARSVSMMNADVAQVLCQAGCGRSRGASLASLESHWRVISDGQVERIARSPWRRKAQRQGAPRLRG